MPVTIRDIEDAQSKIAGSVIRTPCLESIPLSEITGCRIFCKFENLQRTGSFKERGARYALLALTPEQRRLGVIAASAGNHALGLAWHGGLLGIPVTVVMPKAAPLIKITTCEQMGAHVILHGATFEEARQHAHRLGQERSLRYINGYNDPEIIAGQGTLGLEIIDQTPEVEAVIVPIGGGGLIAGVGLAIHSRRPNVKIYGVEPENVASFSAALAQNAVCNIPSRPTLADGLAVVPVGDLAFEIAKEHLEKVITVSEDQIALAVLRLVEIEKSVVEGAGASPLAALLSGKLPELAGKTVVLPLCGGNIDPLVLSRVIEKGLVADGRLARIRTRVSDRPGGLAGLTRCLADAGANVIEIVHDRAFGGPDVSAVHVICTIETKRRSHLAELKEKLEAAGYECV
ncbi:MAG TPA: threonine ammonia-lyase [Chthoniobacterales bacterium]